MSRRLSSLGPVVGKRKAIDRKETMHELETHLLILPLSPVASQVFGLADEVTLKDLRGTTTLDVYAAPVHFWQSLSGLLL